MLLCLVSCENRLTNDPSERLCYSVDTLSFDTVFTYAGSATRIVMVHNPNKHAQTIHSVRLAEGERFCINFDGEQDLSSIRDVTLAGGDSLYIFVRATIDPEDRDAPLLVEDRILMEVGDHTEQIVLTAYGWDVEIIDERTIRHNTTLDGRKPYLVRSYLLVDSTATLTIAPGCQFFMQNGAQIVCYGGLIADATIEQPIRFSSDRLDDIYEGIPYTYVGGKWDGIYLVRPDTVLLRNVEIISGNVGFYAVGSGREHITIENSRIHNHALYGVVLQDVDALIGNSEISNCAQYCVYLAGGRFDFVHTTVASYFNATRYAIQTTQRIDSIAPMYINDLSKSRRSTEVHFLNSVLSGAQTNCLMLATPLPRYYTGEFAFSYMQTDTMDSRYAHDLIYGQKGDTLFVNSFYYEKEEYYDFRPDSASLLCGIADSAIATRYPLDLQGNARLTDGHPDAGCYEFTQD